ncbi:S-methyl-5-thioribose-1-phosphate isomerase [Kaistia algarum]|uniref:S-methyl-5-thioribose-1-phosphate isomerase n=1 Tax=Kaistia algarum TaxID=2083279 RepID=UPI000CE78294|nr:S-methyl-5-thioribose-1-phosphate isomerase [Kaistia algarum]MCX5513485.1 S-methyl-5-thioribose-1-phosphate isomerase [Kaistia algarum]PPE78115.1 S-methyl-5-thioribose-1-phosphate isomerase [Kaistia algarum]
MKVDGVSYRAIWREPNAAYVVVVDQTLLPHRFETRRLENVADAIDAIKRMVVRGAPLIGVTGAYGYAMALHEDASDDNLAAAFAALNAARPTAVNLRWALEIVRAEVAPFPVAERAAAAYAVADRLHAEDIETNGTMASHGAQLIREIWEAKGRSGPVNILTHCNTGWIACVDWGTALGVVYRAHDNEIPVHVWVDETRPRNQGASLTTWELGSHGVPHTLIADNAGGHLMQHGEVDICLVGADRVTADGDACNKIGTYLKALAARDNNVPFYVVMPSSTIDWRVHDGVKEIEIEERASDEVTHITGVAGDGTLVKVRLTPKGTRAANPAFDVTPARLLTGLITERGVAHASREGLLALFPERA